MPFTCHGCAANTPNNQRRRGRCTFCFSKTVSLCPSCAFWEHGPPPRALQDELRPRSRRRVGTIIKTCPPAPVVRDAHAAQLLLDLDAQCATVAGQRAHHGFDADGNNRGGAYDPSGGYAFAGGHAPEANQAPGLHGYNSDAADGTFDATVQAMLDDYDDLYARAEPVGGAGNQAKSDNDLERVMLVVLASAHERCGYVNDRYVHRWDAPTIAARHFAHCFAGLGAIGAATQLGLAPTVLGSTVVEDLVSGKLSVAYAYWRVVDEVGNPADRPHFVRLSAILLHLWLKNAPARAIPNNANFAPHGAPGMVTPAMKADLLSGNQRAFASRVERKLAALQSCFLAPAPHIPAHHRRFHDANVHNNALLTARQQRFLQSLPLMDTPALGGAATPCEAAIRARIRKMLGRIRAGFTGPAGPGAGVVTQALLAASTDTARNNVIDTIVQTLHKRLTWIETSSSARPFIIYDGLAPGARPNFRILSFAEVGAANVAWSHTFPDCMAAMGATFAGQAFLPDMLHPAYVNDGRQNARRWYSDWRWDKDHRVYGGHGLAGDERGTVAQLSLHANAPFPNHHYGVNTVVWSAAVLERAVMLVGDKGRPLRSMTLLLHDLLTCPPDVTGEPSANRAETIRALLEHVDANHNVNVAAYVAANPANAMVTGPAPPAAPTTARTVLLDRLRGVIARHGAGDYTDGSDSGQRVITELASSVNLSPIIECHIFGETQLHRDAWAVIIQDATIELGLAPGTALQAPHAWVACLHPAPPAPPPPFNTARYRGLPIGLPPWQLRRQNPLPDPPGHPLRLQTIVAKIPKYS